MLRRIGLLVVISSLLAGCNLLFDVARRQFTVKLEPAELTIARGESAEISVTITPYTGVDLSLDEATVKLIDPPEGISADTLVMPGNILKRNFVIEVSADAGLLEAEEVTIEVEKGGVGNDETFKLTVTP
jgi:hypothetical protein